MLWGNWEISRCSSLRALVRFVGEATASRKLYSQMLGISFKGETGGYLHTEALKGANTVALWPLSQAAQSCFGKDPGPRGFLRRKPSSSLTLRVSKRRLLSLNRKGIECSSRTGKNPGARLSAASSLRRDCCSELPSLHPCETKSNASYIVVQR